MKPLEPHVATIPADVVDLDEKQEPLVCTLEELKNLQEEAFAIGQQIDELETRKSLLRGQIQTILETHELDRFDSETCTSILGERRFVSMPEDQENKQRFFEWMRDRGIYWRYATVNSNALNSLYENECVACAERGELSPTIPGLSSPSIRTTLTIKKKTKRRK